jgi:hypothetical protein
MRYYVANPTSMETIAESLPRHQTGKISVNDGAAPEPLVPVVREEWLCKCSLPLLSKTLPKWLTSIRIQHVGLAKVLN